MTCEQCGYELDPFETTCPRCAAMERKSRSGTRVFPDPNRSKTKYLVRIESCKQCNGIIFADQDFCPSCGEPVNRNGGLRRQSGLAQLDRKSLVVGVSLSLACLVILLLMISVLRH